MKKNWQRVGSDPARWKWAGSAHEHHTTAHHSALRFACVSSSTPTLPLLIILFLPALASAQVGPQASIACPAGSILVLPGQAVPTTPGSTVCLGAGVHRPLVPIYVTAGMTIVGEYGAIIDGTNVVQSWDTPATSIISGWNCADCSGVTIRNLVIRNLSQYNCVGANGPNAHSWTVDHNEISGCNWGVNIGQTARPRVTHNYIHHNINGQRSAGFTFYMATDVLLEGNEIAYNGHEQKFVMSANLVARNNWVHHNPNGLWFDGDNVDILVEGNVFEDNTEQALYYEISGRGRVLKNIFRRSGGAAVYVSTSQDVEITGNTLEDNYRGIAYFVRCGGVYPPGQPDPTNIGWDLRNNTATHNTVRVSSQPGALANYLAYTECTPTQLAAYTNGSQLNTFAANTYIVPSQTTRYWTWGDAAMLFSEWQGIGMDTDGSAGGGGGTEPPPDPEPEVPPVDDEEPTISLRVQRNGRSNNYTVTTTCEDNVGCTRFELKLDGALVSSVPGALTLAIRVRGQHAVTAQGWDAAGNASAMATQTVVR